MRNDNLLAKLGLLAALVGIDFLPYLGGLLRYHGTPPGYGAFPPVPPLQPPPGFNLAYFIGYGLVAAWIAGVYLFPSLYGFKKVRLIDVPVATRPLPHWFWTGAIATVVFWGLMWFGSPALAKFTFVPLWFSFILTLDGLVFWRTGTSIATQRRNELLTLAIVSIVGWYSFEYLNYFVLEAWLYPYGSQLLTQFGIIVYYSLSFTTVWPAVFEWYMLLMSFRSLKLRWEHGPELPLGKGLGWLLLLAGVGLSIAVVFEPYKLFWGIWAAPGFLLLAALELGSYWSPLDEARKGRWSRLVVMALGAFLNGIVWEFWNYGSDQFHVVNGQLVHTNPNFWIYLIPYVDVLKPWSEMPLLGYFGYFGFGIICWVLWLAVAHLTGLDPDFALADVRAADGLQPSAELAGTPSAVNSNATR